MSEGPFPRMEMVHIEDQKEGHPPYALFWIMGIGNASIVKQWMTEPEWGEIAMAAYEFRASHVEHAR